MVNDDGFHHFLREGVRRRFGTRNECLACARLYTRRSGPFGRMRRPFRQPGDRQLAVAAEDGGFTRERGAYRGEAKGLKYYETSLSCPGASSCAIYTTARGTPAFGTCDFLASGPDDARRIYDDRMHDTIAALPGWKIADLTHSPKGHLATFEAADAHNHGSLSLHRQRCGYVSRCGDVRNDRCLRHRINAPTARGEPACHHHSFAPHSSSARWRSRPAAVRRPHRRPATRRSPNTSARSTTASRI